MRKYRLSLVVGFFLFALYRFISVLLLPKAEPIQNGDVIRKPRTTTRANIVQAFDGASYSIGTKASIFSILKNAADSSLVTIHLFHFPSDRELCQKEFDFVNRLNGTLQLHEFVLSDVQPYINDHLLHERLKSPGNYVRFLLAERLLNASRCLWMDSDTIVSGDILELFANLSTSDFRNKSIATFLRHLNDLSQSIWDTFSENGVNVSATRLPSFNAGIMMFNLDHWRLQNVTGKIQELVQINRREKLITAYGSQWPLQILFSGTNFHQLDPSLYVEHLGWKRGWKRGISSRKIKRALFLHWNGKHKPWLKGGNRYYKWAWKEYDLEQVCKRWPRLTGNKKWC